jgi:hypothetical protein
MSQPVRPTRATPAQAALYDALERVGRLHDERQRNPRVAAALERVAAWQALRLRNTYQDLAADPRYADAITFFQTDLYGGADFAQRDADLARVVPVMARMLPERVIATVARATELNALSQELDRQLLAQLPSDDGVFSVAEYCSAFRALGRRADRERQIGLIGEIGAALDGFVHKPLIHTALVMMRQPARLAGLAVLHDLLERGYDAFRKMRGADYFLTTVVARETALVDRVFAGDSAPFPDPLATRTSA